MSVIRQTLATLEADQGVVDGRAEAGSRRPPRASAQSSALYRNGLPMREIVYERIRDRVLNGQYVPGTRLVERDLAAEFEVSRSPVREALRRLQHEGLAESLATRGVVVKKLTRKDVTEIFDLREALEGLAARLAAERVAAGTPCNLTEYVHRAQAAVAELDFDAAHAANTEFHDQLIIFSDNDNLQATLVPLMGRLHWIFRQILDFRQVYREHDGVAHAIESGDPVEARRVAEAHVQSYRVRTLEYLFE